MKKALIGIGLLIVVAAIIIIVVVLNNQTGSASGSHCHGHQC